MPNQTQALALALMLSISYLLSVLAAVKVLGLFRPRARTGICMAQPARFFLDE